MQKFIRNWQRVTISVEHNWSPGSDELSVIEAPEGKLLTYFDVSCDASVA